MAIYNGRILIRRGNEADFDASKLMAGEWAVSLDQGIVRICLQTGNCIRMATYDAFEADMARIEDILLQCQDIEQAVTLINQQVSDKAQAVAEYTAQAKQHKEDAKQYSDSAKQYRDEAKQYRDEAQAVANVDIATTTTAGIVKPDGTTITVDADGTIHSVGGGGTGGTTDYTDLQNKPKINGVELNGDLSTSDLKISMGTVDYEQLNNIPKINGVELKGDKATTDLNIDYSDLQNKPKINGTEINGEVTIDVGTDDYIDLQNKPKINGVELTGELTSSDLNISEGTTDYEDLSNKPSINGVELKGALTSEDLNISSGGGGNEVELTQAEYDALPDSKYTDGVTYYITDAGIDATKASNVAYSNTTSEMSATNVQDAVDELSGNVAVLSESFGGLRFGYDGDSNAYGYYGADDSFIPFSDVAEVYYHFTKYNQSYTTDRELYLIGKSVADGGTNTVVYIGDTDYTNPQFLEGKLGVQTIPSGTTVSTRNKDAGTYNLYLIDKMPKNNTFYIKQTVSF